MHRVVELGHVVAAPFAGLVLAHLGFDVIKVEPPGGDRSRYDDVLGDSMFVFNNRGKRSVVLDLKSSEGKEAFLRLLRTSSVLIENLSPGSMERLGLGREKLREANPRLVHVSVRGYGGSLSNYPAFGTLVEALTGMMWANGGARLPASITDMWASMNCVVTVLWALLAGAPGYYEVGIAQGDAELLGYYLLNYQRNGRLLQGGSDALPFWAPYETFVTGDGKRIYVAVNDDGKWRSLCQLLGLTHLVDDPRFRTNADRVRNREELHRAIQERFDLADSSVVERLVEADVPAVPVHELKDVLLLDAVEWESVDGAKVPRLPLPGKLGRAPKVGEHTEEVLRELGYEGEELMRLSR